MILKLCFAHFFTLTLFTGFAATKSAFTQAVFEQGVVAAAGAFELTTFDEQKAYGNAGKGKGKQSYSYEYDEHVLVTAFYAAKI